MTFANGQASEEEPAGGGAIFFVSNDRTGSLVITDSELVNNPSEGFETDGYPGIFVLVDGEPDVEGSTLE